MESNIFAGVDVKTLVGKMTTIASRKMNRENAKDVAQNVIVQALESFDSSRGITVENYCFIALKGKMVDSIKYNSRRKMVGLPTDKGLECQGPNGKDGHREMFKQTLEAFKVGRLNRKQYQVLAMGCFQFSGLEIAERMGLSTGRISQLKEECKLAMAS